MLQAEAGEVMADISIPFLLSLAPFEFCPVSAPPSGILHRSRKEFVRLFAETE
jgi:hypothetical protein